MLTLVKSANLGLMFFLELAVYIAVAIWGFSLDAGPVVRLLAGLGGLVLFGVVWAVFGSPKAIVRLHGPGRGLLDVIWFGGGGLALFAAVGTTSAAVFTAAFIVNAVLRIVWHQ